MRRRYPRDWRESTLAERRAVIVGGGAVFQPPRLGGWKAAAPVNMQNAPSSNAGSWLGLLQQFALELALVEPGKDSGLLPINCLLMQFEEFVTADSPPQPIPVAVTAARARIDQLFETTALFDAPTIAWLSEWQTWMQSALESWEAGRTLPALRNAERAAGLQPAEETLATQMAAASDSSLGGTQSRQLQTGDTLSPKTIPFPSGGLNSNTSTEPAIRLNLGSDAELLREFVNESLEHLDNIERGVLVLEEKPADADTLASIFRAFHTFKGGSGFLQLTAIQDLAHELESLLDSARQHKLPITSGVIDLILEGRDALKRFIAEIEAQLSGQSAPAPIVIPTRQLIRRVSDVLTGATSQERAASLQLAVGSPDLPVANRQHAFTQGRAGCPQLPGNVTNRERRGEDTPPYPPSAAPESGTANPASGKSDDSAAPREVASRVVKVDTQKLDSLVDMIGELVIAQSMVVQDPAVRALQKENLSRNLAQLRRITNELQRTAMALRMMPIGGTFHKMARLIRDLSASQGKKIRLLIEGGETELDRNMVELIADPLVHMIRNSVDHGIESAEKRAVNGKPVEGTIHLRAFHKGGTIVVEVQDDGGGLNKDRIRQKALERGLIQESDALSERDIYRLIFKPGFSTAEIISDVSGRGVGMDVVLRNIEKLRGKVEIDSTPGQGARFTVHLPLTLAIIDGLIVGAGSERYILPTLSVKHSFRPTREMISTVHERGEMVNVRGQLTPLLRLYEHFNVRPRTTNPTEAIFVVVESEDQTRCLMVDELIGKQEVVIKNLSESLGHNRALAGAAILGDGRVGLILDVDSLVKLNAPSVALAA